MINKRSALHLEILNVSHIRSPSVRLRKLCSQVVRNLLAGSHSNSDSIIHIHFDRHCPRIGTHTKFSGITSFTIAKVCAIQCFSGQGSLIIAKLCAISTGYFTIRIYVCTIEDMFLTENQYLNHHSMVLSSISK